MTRCCSYFQSSSDCPFDCLLRDLCVLRYNNNTSSEQMLEWDGFVTRIINEIWLIACQWRYCVTEKDDFPVTRKSNQSSKKNPNRHESPAFPFPLFIFSQTTIIFKLLDQVILQTTPLVPNLRVSTLEIIVYLPFTSCKSHNCT